MQWIVILLGKGEFKGYDGKGCRIYRQNRGRIGQL